MFKHVPNILTMCRFVLIPFIFGSIVNNQYVAAFIFLTLSGITDILDGFIARKFNLITNFGKLIDPLADKATQISTLIALLFAGIIPDWILIVVFIKETIMIAGASCFINYKLLLFSNPHRHLHILCSTCVNNICFNNVFQRILSKRICK